MIFTRHLLHPYLYISGYPTFKYLNYGKNTKDYEFGREEDDFVAFMEDPANPKPPKKKVKKEG